MSEKMLEIQSPDEKNLFGKKMPNMAAKVIMGVLARNPVSGYGILVDGLWYVDYMRFQCGDCMEVYYNEKWIPTTIEKDEYNQWYLMGTPFEGVLDCLIVRVGGEVKMSLEQEVLLAYMKYQKDALFSMLYFVDKDVLKVKAAVGNDIYLTVNVYGDIIDKESGRIIAVSDLPHVDSAFGYRIPSKWKRQFPNFNRDLHSSHFYNERKTTMK